MRTLIGGDGPWRSSARLLAATLAGCGTTAPPPIEVLLSADGTHPCAGAVMVEVTLGEVNGDDAVTRFDAAIAPEQLDCAFVVGIGEALFAVSLGEIDVSIAYRVSLELHDSTGLVVAVGSSEPFRASSDGIDPIAIELTRFAPLGTALVDVEAVPQFQTPGDLDVVVLAGSDPIGSRSLAWPADGSLKRPLRISGLSGTGLHLLVELSDGSGTVVASALSDVFSLGSTPDAAFATPPLTLQ